MEFFRHCPGCGRRFHIKLERKEMLSVDREKIPTLTHAVRETGTDVISIPVVVHDQRPIVLDIEEFQYHYKCSHCNHEWTEHHREEHREH